MSIWERNNENMVMVQVNNVMLGVCQPQEFSHLYKKEK